MKNQVLNVLLVEDDHGDAIIVERALEECQQSFVLRHCECLQDALEALTSSEMDVILLDLSLPDSFGLSALKEIHLRSPNLPIVVLTGLADDSMALQALEHGAQDYLIKGMVNEHLLERTLRYAVQRQQIQTENLRLLSEMKELARRDALTGALNRHSFSQNLDREWERAVRYRSHLSCIVLDIDFFKRVNDTYGHLMGDLILKRVAATLLQTCRNSDSIGRMGGEEFSILLPETSETAAVELAERIRQDIASIKVVDNEEEVFVTVSLGVASFDPEIQNPQTLVDRADKAMFAAKQQGRDRVVNYRELNAFDSGDQASSWKGIKIRKLMSPLTVTVDPHQRPVDCIEQMIRNSVDWLPVVNRLGTLVGVIEADDLLAMPLARGKANCIVSDLMKTRFVTYSADSNAAEVCGFLCRSGIDQIFILEGDKPVGVIRRYDFIRDLGRRQLRQPAVDAIPETKAVFNALEGAQSASQGFESLS